MRTACRFRRATTFVAALVAAGCAIDPAALTVGAGEAEVRARLGAPTAVHAVPGGTRLEYATGPYGKFTWMLDLDAAGTLRQTRQVLTEAQFNAIVAGLPARELRTTLGRPADLRRIERQRQTVWQYRYDGPFCLLFQVGVGDDGKVVDTGYGPDPMCEVHEPDGVR